MEIILFKNGDGWGYKVQNVVQEFHPDKEGFVLMTYDQAAQYAQIIFDRLNKDA
jgi:hypothetical protein